MFTFLSFYTLTLNVILYFCKNKLILQMNYKRKTITITLLIALCVGIAASTYVHSKSVDDLDEDNTNYVRDIVQDKDGFIWFGTTNGLCRYDGYNMVRILPSDDPKRVLLLDNRLQAIDEWKDQYIWIRLRGRQYSCYDIKNDMFVDYTADGTYKDTYRNYTITNDSSLWVYDNEKGCKRIQETNGVFKATTFSEGSNNIPSNNIEFIEDGLYNRIWLGTAKGLLFVTGNKVQTVDKSHHFVSHITTNNRDYFISKNGEVYMAHDNGSITLLASPKQAGIAMPNAKASAASKRKIYITTEGATFEYDLLNHRLTQSTEIQLFGGQQKNDNRRNRILYTPNGDIWYFGKDEPIHLSEAYSENLLQLNSDPHFEFVTDKDGTILISTFGNGIYAYNPHTGLGHHFSSKPDSENKSLLKTDYLINLYEDKAGNIWACQEFAGAVCITKETKYCDYYYFTTQGETDHSNVIKLLKRTDDDIIYVANMYNGFRRTNGNLEGGQDLHIINDDVVAMTTDKAGHQWLGTRKSGVYVDGRNYQNTKDDPQSLDKGKISDIFCDSKGRVWISIFDKGIDCAEPDGAGGYRFRHFFKKKGNIDQPRSMIQDHTGHIWVTSNDGVFYFHPDELMKDPNQFQHLQAASNTKAPDETHCVYEDKEHNVWVGTIGSGVALFDNNNPGKPLWKKNITTEEGLSNNNVQQIVGDARGRIWIGTDNGLSIYTPKKELIHTLFPSINSKGNMFTENTAITMKDHRIAFGTRQGVLIVNPEIVHIRESLFPLAITDIDINGVSYRNMKDDCPIEGSLRDAKKIKLSHDQNSLTFYFSDFNYSASKKTKYTYIMTGVDKDWSPLSTINFATYKGLLPGTYHLQVKSRNENGNWNKTVIDFEIRILPPWWATWWAYLLYFLLISGIIVITYQQIKRINNLKNQVEVEAKLTEYKLQFFTNISHEFRTPLTIIKGAMDKMTAIGDIPGSLKQPIASMRKSTDRMLRLISQLIEFRKMQQDKLQLALEEADIIAFLKDIFYTFHEVAENKNINYLFSTSCKEHHMYFDKNYIDKIVYNLLSNALKYTPSKHSVTLQVKQDEQNKRILISVKDTGIGIPKEKQNDLFKRFNRSSFIHDSIGIGLHLTQELVHVHHGTITFADNDGGGSIFTVSLPDDKDVYDECDFLVTNSTILEEENGKIKTPPVDYKEIKAAPMNDINVLVVEDDTNIQEFLYDELSRYFHVDKANNGEEALEKISQQKPALIISDVIMPIMSGTELTDRIRKDERFADIPIILLTALTAEKNILKGLGSGADAYIEKPFSMSVLVAHCVQLLEQRYRLRTNYAKEIVTNAVAPEIITEEQDKHFKELLDIWLTKNLTDTSLNINRFAENMGYGRTTFFKKVKKITGLTPNDYIKDMRMNQAAKLLKDPKLTISEVSYMVGINDPYYFSKLFKSFFGITPSNYRKGKKRDEE